MPDGYGGGIDLVAGAEAKQTPGRGRGVFAVKAFKVGDEIDFLETEASPSKTSLPGKRSSLNTSATRPTRGTSWSWGTGRGR